MCGIIGYVGHRHCQKILLEGLRRLEYRGYDSAGLAWLSRGEIECVRAVGNLDSLDAALVSHRAAGNGDGANGAACNGSYAVGGSVTTATAAVHVTTGIGHTRWATHGGVTEENAHPHSDQSGGVRIVLNGIVENYLELREQLAGDGVRFSSQTDAEIVAHLIATYYEGHLAEAVRRSLEQMCGHYAIVAMCKDEPDTLVGVRHECPLVLGMGRGEQFLASSIAAFASHTREVSVLGDDQIVVLRPHDVTVTDHQGIAMRPRPTRIDWDDDDCQKEGYETFMLKEIHEQDAAVAETLSRWRADAATRGDGPLSRGKLYELSRIVIVGCGTSYHAGLAGRLAIERWARVPVDVDLASEFRYREPILGPNTLVLGITQSGETADTLAAMRLARAQGATVVALTNAVGSQATREADATIFTRAGIEIGVAATKTFVSQVALLYALALRIAAVNGRLGEGRVAELQQELELLPQRIEAVLESIAQDMRELGEQLAPCPFFLYLGRLAGVPVALEGALKLKEISYAPTDAYAAGEMKHGPIALLSRETPVVCVAIEDGVLPKLLSNLSEVRARGAQVVAVAPTGCKQIAEHAEHIVYIPRTDPLLQVVLAVIPLQLFAYHLARARGLNVDQPRNLAKTVTVE